jgi:proteasome lid subunit RPN8/RPN11
MTPAVLQLPRPIFAAMVEHAERTAPDEAIGLLGGHPDGIVVSLKPLRNLAGRDKFLADPYDQYRAVRSFRERGLSPVAVYHSHPGGGTSLSTDDIRFARDLALVHVVVACARLGAEPAGTAAYVGTSGAIEPIPIVIVD